MNTQQITLSGFGDFSENAQGKKDLIKSAKANGVEFYPTYYDHELKGDKKAMKFYCSNYDICEGYKHALIECINDQYDNHNGLIDYDNQQAVKELSDILNGAI